jgi:DNA invertase Pin-like site-specific DNA recombinase
MKIGDARVSTSEQSLDLQFDALKLAGCEKIYREKISVSGIARKELEEAFKHFRAGDSFHYKGLKKVAA